MSWALQHNRIELCGNLRAVREPGGTLIELFRLRRDKGAGKIRFYTGEDKTILNAHATTETPVVVIATRTPRRTVEQQYLRQFCEIEEISGQPQALSVRDASRRSTAENALTYRIKSLLESDYFVDADVTIGKVSHGLPLLVDIFGGRNRVVLSESAGCNTAFIELYSSDFAAFGSMIKDYVRSVLFPKIQHLVPSAHRQGAAAFLKAIARPREVFEYEVADLQSLNEIWARYAEGSISFDQAATRSSEIARASVQFIESGSARPAREVIADVMDNEAVVATIVTTEDRAGEPLPAIDRAQTATEAKILLIADDEQSIRGFRCFVALADRVRDERGEFFLEPHRTSVVWGGQRVLFVFQHVSGEYGLYYDLQAPALVAETSGGGTYETCTVLMKNRIFIPVPPQVQAAFVPQHGERKRFEVKCDILYLGDT
jgi:molecular chaperone HtpG